MALSSLYKILMGILLWTTTVAASSPSSSGGVMNRRLTSSVSAPTWSTQPSNAICETFAYFSSLVEDESDVDSQWNNRKEEDGVAYSILSEILRRLRLQHTNTTTAASSSSSGLSLLKSFHDGVKLAMEVVRDRYPNKASFSSLHDKLLPVELSLRAYAPFCEMHRSLAREARYTIEWLLLSSSSSKGEATAAELVRLPLLEEAFVVFQMPNKILYALSIAELKHVLQHVSRELNYPSTNTSSYKEDDLQTWTRILPKEYIYQQQQYDKQLPTAILYGNADSLLFASFFKFLEEANIPMVVRFMGYVQDQDNDQEEEVKEGRKVGIPLNSSRNNAQHILPTTYLQGYGVRLDIRNVEYTAFDNTPQKNNNDTDTTKTAATTTSSSEGNQQQQQIPIDKYKNEDIDVQGAIMELPSPMVLNLQQFIQQHSILNQTDINNKAVDPLISFQRFMTQAQKIPSKTQWKDLALQATTIITTAWNASMQDPLWTLQELVQNLPSYASSLVSVHVPSHIRQAAIQIHELLGITSSSQSTLLRQLLQSKSNADGFFELYINGRKVSMQSPTLNIFHILHILREEDQLLHHMYQTLGPFLPSPMTSNATTTHHSIVLEKLSNWITMGKEEFERQAYQKQQDENTTDSEDDPTLDFLPAKTHYRDNSPSVYTPVRIDVGHGYRGAVMYLNDIEKDSVYKNWPRQVSHFVMAMQFQGAPRIRRNMLTVLLVIDPSNTDASEASDISMTIQMLLNMVQSGFPLRMGLVLVHDEDVLDCKKQLQDMNPDSYCQVPGPFYYDSSKDPEDASSSTHTAFLMVQHALKSYDGFFALQYVGKMMEDLSTVIEKDEPITLDHLITFHTSIMSMIDVSPEDAVSDIESLLSLETNDVSGDISYANAITFAARKNVESGFAFVNGRPTPLSDPRDLQTVLMEELQYITELIQVGRITDSKPRSVYGLLLDEERVYPKMHRLLAESTKGVYNVIVHDYNHSSILTTMMHSSETFMDLNAIYLLEVAFDPESEYGIAFALSCMDAIQILLENIKMEKKYEGMAMAVRLIPSKLTADDDTVGMIVNCAGLLEVDEFYKFLLLKKSTLDNATKLESHNEIIDMLAKIRKNDNCRRKSAIMKFSSRSNYISLNGRYYAPSDEEGIYADDLEILIDLEKKRSRTITQELKSLVPEDQCFDIIGRIAAYFGQHFSSDKAQRKDVDSILTRVHLNSFVEPLIYSWNQDQDKIRIVCFLDPLTEAAQRATPFLEIVRDSLQLPLTIILVPRLEVHEDSHVPISSYYRFVSAPDAYMTVNPTQATFDFLPTNHVLTVRMDVPESWDVQQTKSIQDTDNLRCDAQRCGDSAFSMSDDSFDDSPSIPLDLAKDSTHVEYGLNSLLFFGQCWDVSVGSPPNGLQLTLSSSHFPRHKSITRSRENGRNEQQLQILPDGTTVFNAMLPINTTSAGSSLQLHSDTLVMKTLGYWQLRANPGVWKLEIASHSKGADIFEIIDGAIDSSGAIILKSSSDNTPSAHRTLVMKDYISKYQPLLVRRKPGFEDSELFDTIGDTKNFSDEDTVHVFSLATGHLYERFLKIMMLSVTKRTSTRVKFWLFENFLSPGFKAAASYMADRIGCQVEFVTYKWPEWLRGQSEKQRIIWGYKILFLDVLFPLNLKKIIYVDADQVVRSDLKELWDLDLEGAPYGYTPFCDSRESTLGYQFWRQGFWKDHLHGKPYHISALYVIDLERFRRELVGDHLRAVYQQLSADPSSLSNLDQDLPNYVQDVIKIHSLPQEWLWCESWCSDETKASAKTIDLCNNPEHKEPKVSMAKRIISGPLFPESWIELDKEVESYEKEYFTTQKARRE